MSERYTRLFSLPENLYSDSSPVVIAAGALLKDNQSGRVLAQLKLRSVSTPKIKAVTVRIIMKDVTGKPLGSAVEHQYLDINIARDEEFGQKVPVILPDNTTRGIDVSVVQVIFDNNRILNTDGGAWIPLVAPTRLRSALGDGELEKEYKRKFGSSCEYLPCEQNGLWYCSCGALNLKQESSCRKCNRQLATLLAVDLDALRKEKDARLAREAAEAAKARAEAAKARAEAEAKRKKAIKIGIIVALVALVVGSISAVILTKPARVIKEADEIVAASGDYMAAVALLDELNKPKKTAEARQGYIDAMESEIQALIDEKDYPAALNLIEKYSILETAEKNIKHIQTFCLHDLEDTAKADATCTADGYDRKTCTICGCVKEKTFKALGHKFTSEVTKESTCTEHGTEVFTCSVCNEEETKELDLLPHDYKDTVTKQPTCTETGTKLSVCKTCNDSKEENIPMAAHSNKDKILVAATCTAKGSKQTVCSVCGKEEAEVAIAALGHDYSRNIAAANSCTTDGQAKFTCTRCNDSYTEVIKATGHNWKAATCTAPKTCSGCGQTEGSALGHSWTVSGKGMKCTRCSLTRMPEFNYTSSVPFAYEHWNESGKLLHGTAYFTSTRAEARMPSSGPAKPVVNVYFSGYTDGDFVIEIFHFILYDEAGNVLDESYDMLSNMDPGPFEIRALFGGVHDSYTITEDQTYKVKIVVK